MTKFLIDGVGWLGAGLLLVAYACVSFRKLRADSFWYQSMNGIGSLFLVVNTFYYRAFPSTFVKCGVDHDCDCGGGTNEGPGSECP